MFIELTDSKLGQGAVGFVFKGYVFPKTQTRFKQKTFAAVKVGFLLELNYFNLDVLSYAPKKYGAIRRSR
jgi:hypothetical protein